MASRKNARELQFFLVGLVLTSGSLGVIVLSLFVPSISNLVGLSSILAFSGLGLIAVAVRRMALRCGDETSELSQTVEVSSRRIAEQHQRSVQQDQEIAALVQKLRHQSEGFQKALAEQSERQAWLESVLMQLPSGILLVDKSLNVVTRNARFHDLLGLPKDAPPVRSLMDFHGWPAETPDGAEIAFDDWPLVRALRDGVTTIDQHLRVGLHGGGWFDAVVSAAPIHNPRGEIRGGVLLINDLKVRQDAGERLRLLESAVVHAHDAIIVLEAVSAEGRGRSVRYVNDAFTRLTGYTREEVLGRSLHFLRGVDTDSETLENLRVALDTATPFRTELLNYRKDGSVVWVDLSLVPVQGPDGFCTHYIMIQRDITARKVAEGSLRESEELFRGIFETTSAGVSITDETGKFVSCNPAFAAMVGRTMEELRALTPADITHPDDWAALQSSLQAVQSGATDRYQFPKRYVRPDGSIVWAELTFSAIKDADGNYQYGLGVSVDVTARRQLEDQLRQAQKMEALGQLAGGIAHDFNNLLTAVLGNLGMVRLPPDDPNTALIRTVEQAAGRAADLTRKLLGYARRNQLLLAPTRPEVLIAEVVDILRHTLDPRIEIVVAVETDSIVEADATLINQALINLCLNARDAMPNGGTLTLAADDIRLDGELPHPDARPGAYVRLTVSDTGLGISEEIRNRLFEPFFTTKSVGKGTGLGLPMVHGIMKQHEGFVTMDSTPGSGASFSLYLPAAGALARPESSPSRPESPLQSTPPPPRNSTILIVDDEDMIRNLGRSILEADGFKVLEAGDGVDAVDLFERERDRISLVLLDMTMPRLSGRDAFQQMRQIDPGVRVLFSSGYSPEDVSEIDGSAGLLTKPYRPNDLLVAVRKALSPSRGSVGF